MMKSSFLSLFGKNRYILMQLLRRDVVGRYRGSILGLMWSFLHPLMMLAIYNFVFTTVLRVRWAVDTEGEQGFAVILFAGLIIHGIAGECLGRAPTLLLGNVNFVKKVVFPLEVLPVIVVLSALLHAFIGLLILFGFKLIMIGSLSWTLLLSPFVIFPYILVMLGVSWALAAIGVYLRDVSHIAGVLVTALLFLSPVLYPLSVLPESLRGAAMVNPLSFIIEQLRATVIFNQQPDWVGLGVYSLIALVIAATGFMVFQMTRKGFADVL